MKSIHKKNYCSNSNSTSSSTTTEHDFVAMAGDLDLLAKAKLPDACLDGILRGHEAEIRQDALILSLRWFANKENETDWIPARSMAYALRFIKMRYARRLTNEPELIPLDGDQPLSCQMGQYPDNHDTMSTRPHASEMVLQAITQAAQSGQISPANVSIVLMVLRDGQSVAQIAEKLSLTRGAIYQHINRVRAALPPILDMIEEPGFSSTPD